MGRDRVPRLAVEATLILVAAMLCLFGFAAPGMVLLLGVMVLGALRDLAAARRAREGEE